MRRLGDFSWVEVCKELLSNQAYYMDYGTFPVYFWEYVTALRGGDLCLSFSTDSKFFKDAVKINNICKRYMTLLLRGKGTGRKRFETWFKKITPKKIKKLKCKIAKLISMSPTSFDYLSHYLSHCYLAFIALYKATNDKRYLQLSKCFKASEKRSVINYLETLAQMLEEELKGGEK